MTDIDLKRILDSKANIYANLTTKKLALMTDDDQCLVANNGGTFQKYLVYETSDGVTESPVQNGDRIYTDTAGTGFANPILNNVLSEINTSKMEINNGQGFGLTELNELEVDNTVTADVAKIGAGLVATRAVFGHASYQGLTNGYGYAQDSSGTLRIDIPSANQLIVAENGTGIFTADTTSGLVLGASLGPNIPFKTQKAVTGNNAAYSFEIDDTNQGVIFNSVYNSGAPTVAYEWQVNGTSIFQILEDGYVVSRSANVNCTIESDQDVLLWLRSDMDNVTETDNPIFRMTQDGDGVTTDLGLVGDGTEYTGAAGNNAYWLTDTNAIDIAPAGNREVRIASTGTTFSNSTINMASLPTSSAGLATGDLWNNSGVLNIA
jgi:hypothetical protein